MFCLRLRVAACAISVSAFAAVWPASAYAADVNVPDNTTSTGQKIVNGNDKVTVGAGGKLTSSSNPTILQNSSATGIVIDNSGTIESTGNGARGIRFNGGTDMTFTINNREGGIIQAQDDAIQVSPGVRSGTIVVTNSGLIQSTNGGQGIDFSNIVNGSASVTITNTATGRITANNNDGVRPGFGGVVNNYGRISGTNNGATLTGPGAYNPDANLSADGVDFQSAAGGKVNNYADGSIFGIQHGINFGKADSGTVNNYGTIEGGHHGINNGLDASSNSSNSVITVYNGVDGKIIGYNGSGVGLDTSGVVTNYGLISGRGNPNATNGDGDGVDIDYKATITNYGRIEGIGSRGVGSDGRRNTSEGVAIGGGTVDNKAGAVIIGSGNGILVDDSSQGNAFYAVNITNAGTIEGTNGFGIKIVSAFDNVINNSGKITGGNGTAIMFGSGNDMLNLYTGSVINGLVDGGAGDDVINLNGTGTLGSTVNFERLNVRSGTWTLTGTQAYSLEVRVANGATMLANGTLSGAVIVMDGGTIGGTGSTGDLDVAGTVSPGSGSGQVGTLSVNGNVVFAPTAFFKVDATPAGASDKLAITGTATLAGTVLVSAQSGNWAPSTTTTILTAGGGLRGQFSSVLSDLAFLTPTLSYSAQSVSLTLTRNALGFQSVAQTGNQLALATAISTAPSNNGLFLSIVGQSAQGARATYNAVSGEGLTAAATGAFQAGRAFGSALHGRAYGAGSGAQAGSAAPPPGMMTLGARPGASVAAEDGAKQPSRLRMWASAFDERMYTGGSDAAGSAAQSGRQWGLATGADVRLSPDVTAGVAVCYGEGGLSTDARATHVDTTGYHLGAYGLHRFGGFYLSGSAALSAFDNRSQRTIQAGSIAEFATASFSSSVVSGRIEVGQDIDLAAARVTPFFSLEAARYFADSFTESSTRIGGGIGGLALTANAARIDALPATLGVRVRSDVALPMGLSVQPNLSLAWVHNFARERTLDATFAAIPASSFTVAGARADADLLQARAGLDLHLSPNAVLGAQVGTEQGARTQNISAKGDIRFTW